MSIGDKLRAIDEQAHHSDDIPANRPENKEKAEGSRETILNSANERTGRARRARSEADEERRSER
jgi:hypothetical protein